MKLSKKQKEVVLLMRAGGQMSRFKNKHKMIASLAPWVILGNTQLKLTIKTVEYLIEIGLLETTGEKSTNWHFPEIHYKLTEIGKTIPL